MYPCAQHNLCRNEEPKARQSVLVILAFCTFSPPFIPYHPVPLHLTPPFQFSLTAMVPKEGCNKNR